jgi:hypothetical protein
MPKGLSLLLRVLLLLPLLLVAIIGLALRLQGDSLVLSLVDSLLASEQLELRRGDLHIDLLAGSIMGSQLALFDAERQQPIVTVGRLRAQLQWLDLLQEDNGRTSLAASDVSVFTFTSDEDWESATESVEWLSYRNWLPGSVDIDRVLVHWPPAEAAPPLSLNSVEGRAGLQPGSYDILAILQHRATDVLVNARLESYERLDGDLYGLGLVADLSSKSRGARLQLTGSLREEGEGPWYQGQALVHLQNVSYLMESLELDYPLQGALSVEASARGDFDGIALRDIRFSLDNMPQFSFAGTGEMDYAYAGGNSLDLALQTELQDLHRLVELLQFELGELGNAKASMRLQGSFDDLLVRDVSLQVQDLTGLDIQLLGEIQINDLSAQFLNSKGLEISASAPALGNLQTWTGDLGFETGPWEARGTLLQGEDHLSIRDIAVSSNDGAGLSLSANGSIERLGDLASGDFSIVSGIDFMLELTSAHSQRLTQPFAPDLDELGKVSGRAALRGDVNRLVIEDIDASVVNAERYRLDLSKGRIEVTPAADSPLANLNIGLALELTEATAGRQSGAKTEGNIAAQLSVAHLSPLSQMRLATRLNRVSTSRLLQLTRGSFDYPRESGYLTGKFTLLGAGDNFKLQDINIHNTDNDEIRFSVLGSINNLADPNAIDLNTEFEISNREFLQQLSGLPLSPWKARVHIVGSDGHVQVDSSNRLGDTELDVGFELAVDGEGLASIKGKLDSSVVHLRDIGLVNIVADDTRPPVEPAQSSAGESDRLPLADLPRLPVEFELHVGNLEGENFAAERLHISFSSADGLYTLRRLEVDHTGGNTRASASLDMRTTPPLWTLKGSALDLQLAELMADLGVVTDVTGSVNTSVDLQARGDNAKALLGSLDGDLTLVLEDVTIKGAAYDVLATETVAWFYSGAALEEKTVFTCIMGEFDFEQGKAHSDEMLAESDRMLALGPVDLDFNEMTVNAEITPRSKSRAFQIPGKVKVSGPFDNLDVSSPALAHGVDATTEVVTVIPRFALKIFDTATGFFAGKNKQQDKALTRCQRVPTPQR